MNLILHIKEKLLNHHNENSIKKSVQYRLKAFFKDEQNLFL